MTEQVDTQTEAPEMPWWRRRRDAEAYAEAERRLQRPMTLLALVFTVALALELSQDLGAGASRTLLAVNGVIWLAFAAEYLWRLRLAPDRRRFVRSHLLDLMVVVLPTIRSLRTIRVLRLLAVATRSWRQVFSVLRHRGLGKVISSVFALMIVGGLITFALEPQTFTNVGDAVWWVLVTSTTVGYGDFAPVSTGARLVAVIVMILGIGLVGIMTANIVDFMSEEGRGAAGSAGAAATCPTCRETAERLARMEAQLELLLARPTGPGEDP